MNSNESLSEYIKQRRKEDPYNTLYWPTWLSFPLYISVGFFGALLLYLLFY